MKENFKKRLRASLLSLLLCASMAGNLVTNKLLNLVPDVGAAKVYHGFTNKTVTMLGEPCTVPAVVNAIREDIGQLHDFLNDEKANNGTYYFFDSHNLLTRGIPLPPAPDGWGPAYAESGISRPNARFLMNMKPGQSFPYVQAVNDDGVQLTIPKFRLHDARRGNLDPVFNAGIDSPQTWRTIVKNMPKDIKLIFVPQGENPDTGYLEIRCINLNELKLRAFSIYLQELAGRNPDLSAEELFGSQQVQMSLNTYFGNVPWVEPGSGGNVLTQLTNALSMLGGIGQTVSNFLPDFKEMEASKAALSVFYDSSNWPTKLRYKAGRWGAFGVKVGAGITLPIAAYRFSHWAVDQFGAMIRGTSKFTKDQFLIERNKLLNDPVKLRKAIKKMMQEGVVGLHDTIDRLTTLVTGNLAIRKSSSLLNKNRCQLISFIGPPGMGKSLLAQKYALALTGKPIPSWGYITSASIKPGESPANQFFNANSNLMKNLKRCGGNTVIFLDEIDKYDSNELLEGFRDAVDRGTMVAMSTTSEQKVSGFGKTQTSSVINTETIDVSGLIVIVGTNEKPECWGLEPDPNEPAYNAGRTFVKRSASLVQRFQRFKFNPYTLDEYKQMYDNALQTIKKDSMKMFGLQVSFDENLSQDLAAESQRRLMGGRSVQLILAEMAGAVTSFDIDLSPDKSSDGLVSKLKDLIHIDQKDETRKIKISFDSKERKFKIMLEKAKPEIKTNKSIVK